MELQLRSVLAFILLLSLTVLANGQETRTGRLIAEHRGLKSANCKGGFTPICDGCSNIAICAGGDTPVISQPCSELSPTAPYCVEGGCSAKPPPGQAGCVRSLKCSSQGYFPHPDDCSKYFICTGENGDAFEYSCGPGYIYNSKLRTCQRQQFTTDCHTFNCTNADNTFVVYNPDKAYYGFCLNDKGKKDIIVYKCFHDKTMEFDLVSLSCVFACPNEGRHPNPSDCRSFFECFRVGTELKYTKWPCPSGQYHYSPATKKCEPGPCK